MVVIGAGLKHEGTRTKLIIYYPRQANDLMPLRTVLSYIFVHNIFKRKSQAQ